MSARNWKALSVIGACVMLSGCYSCALNGGWERQMNPFCVERGALVGAAPMSLQTEILSPAPFRSVPRR